MLCDHFLNGRWSHSTHNTLLFSKTILPCLPRNQKMIFKWFLIAALIFSAGYHSAPIFFTIQRIWIVLGRCLFTTRRGVLVFSRIYDSKRSIGEVLFTIQRIWIVLGRCLFYDSKRSIGFLSDLRLEEEYWRSPFFKSILLEWFLKREMKRVKKFGVILVLNKSEERSEKRVVFVHTTVFERARNWCVKNFSLSERIFLFTCGILKQFFFHLFWLRGFLWFCFNFRLVWVVVWRFLEIHMNFMIIRRFLMYFADFRAKFCVFFDDYFVLLAQMAIEETPSTWENLW